MTTILLICLLLLALPAGFALLSFAFAWYEAANRDPALLAGRSDPSALAWPSSWSDWRAPYSA